MCKYNAKWVPYNWDTLPASVVVGAISLKLLGDKLAPKLVYSEEGKELLKL